MRAWAIAAALVAGNRASFRSATGAEQLTIYYLDPNCEGEPDACTHATARRIGNSCNVCYACINHANNKRWATREAITRAHPCCRCSMKEEARFRNRCSMRCSGLARPSVPTTINATPEERSGLRIPAKRLKHTESHRSATGVERPLQRRKEAGRKREQREGAAGWRSQFKEGEQRAGPARNRKATR